MNDLGALLAAPLALAQNFSCEPVCRDPVPQLLSDLERLRQDPAVNDHAARPLACAEACIADLANAPPAVTEEEVAEAEAERLLQRVARSASL